MVKFTPAIFLGLGGSGTRIVSALRSKAISTFQRSHSNDWKNIVDNIFQFVAIDSVPDAKAALLKIPQSNYRKFGRFDVTLAIETQSKFNAARFNKWWIYPYPSMILERAGGMVRINGRLCFLKDVENRPNIATCIMCFMRTTRQLITYLRVPNMPLYVDKWFEKDLNLPYPEEKVRGRLEKRISLKTKTAKVVS